MKFINVCKFSLFLLFCTMNVANADEIPAILEDSHVKLYVYPNTSVSVSGGTHTQYGNFTNKMDREGYFNVSLRFSENVTLESAYLLRKGVTNNSTEYYYWSEIELEYVYKGTKHYHVAYNAHISSGGWKYFKFTYTAINDSGKWDLIYGGFYNNSSGQPVENYWILDPYWETGDSGGESGSHGGAFIDRPTDGFFYEYTWGVLASQPTNWYSINSTAFQYKKEVTITNASAATKNYSSYQVSLNISNSSASQNTFAVVRVLNSTHLFEIPHLLEELNSTHITLWWRINYSISEVNQNFSIYYGNTSAHIRFFSLESVFDQDNREQTPLLELRMDRDNEIAIDFDGSDDYIDVGQPIANYKILTITMWIKPDTLVASAHLIGARYNPDAVLYLDDTNGDLGCFLRNDAGVGLIQIATSGKNLISTNKWSFVGMVANGSHLFLYIDGVLVERLGGLTGAYTSENSFFWGARNDEGSDDHPFDGRSDELMIWDMALTIVELREVMKGDTTIQSANLQRHYTLENDNSTHCIDETGNFYGIKSGSPPETGTFVYDSSQDQDNWQVMELDGANDYLTLIDPYQPGTDDFSICFWIKADSTQTNMPGIISADEVAPDNELILRMSNTGTLNYFDMEIDGNVYAVTISPEPDVTDWSFVLLSVDRSGNYTLYVNDVMVATADISSDSAISLDYDSGIRGNGLTFGDLCYTSDTNRELDGFVDTILIYSKALSVSEGTALYNFDGSKDGLIRYFDMEAESGVAIIDVLGNGNGTIVNGAYRVPVTRFHGTLSGATWNNASPPASAIDGVSTFNNDGYLVFDGSNDYITHATLLDSIPPAIGISFWFSPLVTFDSDQASDDYLITKSNILNDDRFWLKLESDDGKLKLEVEEGGNGIKSIASTTTTWTGGVWFHIVITWTNSGIFMFVNGIEESDNPTVTTLMRDGTHSDFIIGAYFGFIRCFAGKIDDFRIYDHELSANEITAMYYRSKYSASPPLLGVGTEADGLPILSANVSYDYANVQVDVQHSVTITFEETGGENSITVSTYVSNRSDYTSSVSNIVVPVGGTNTTTMYFQASQYYDSNLTGELIWVVDTSIWACSNDTTIATGLSSTPTWEFENASYDFGDIQVDTESNLIGVTARMTGSSPNNVTFTDATYYSSGSFGFLVTLKNITWDYTITQSTNMTFYFSTTLPLYIDSAPIYGIFSNVVDAIWFDMDERYGSISYDTSSLEAMSSTPTLTYYNTSDFGDSQVATMSANLSILVTLGDFSCPNNVSLLAYHRNDSQFYMYFNLSTVNGSQNASYSVYWIPNQYYNSDFIGVYTFSVDESFGAIDNESLIMPFWGYSSTPEIEIRAYDNISYQENGTAFFYDGNWEDPSDVYDGDWEDGGGLSVLPGGSQSGNFYINYTKPDFVSNLSLWNVKYYISGSVHPNVNFSLSQSIWSMFVDQICFRIKVTEEPGDTARTLFEGLSESGWVVINNYTSAYQSYIFEEAVFWYYDYNHRLDLPYNLTLEITEITNGSNNVSITNMLSLLNLISSYPVLLDPGESIVISVQFTLISYYDDIYDTVVVNYTNKYSSVILNTTFVHIIHCPTPLLANLIYGYNGSYTNILPEDILPFLFSINNTNLNTVQTKTYIWTLDSQEDVTTNFSTMLSSQYTYNSTYSIIFVHRDDISFDLHSLSCLIRFYGIGNEQNNNIFNLTIYPNFSMVDFEYLYYVLSQFTDKDIDTKYTEKDDSLTWRIWNSGTYDFNITTREDTYSQAEFSYETWTHLNSSIITYHDISQMQYFKLTFENPNDAHQAEFWVSVSANKDATLQMSINSVTHTTSVTTSWAIKKIYTDDLIQGTNIIYFQVYGASDAHIYLKNATANINLTLYISDPFVNYIELTSSSIGIDIIFCDFIFNRQIEKYSTDTSLQIEGGNNNEWDFAYYPSIYTQDSYVRINFILENINGRYLDNLTAIFQLQCPRYVVITSDIDDLDATVYVGEENTFYITFENIGVINASITNISSSISWITPQNVVNLQLDLGVPLNVSFTTNSELSSDHIDNTYVLTISLSTTSDGTYSDYGYIYVRARAEFSLISPLGGYRFIERKTRETKTTSFTISNIGEASGYYTIDIIDPNVTEGIDHNSLRHIGSSLTLEVGDIATLEFEVYGNVVIDNETWAIQIYQDDELVATFYIEVKTEKTDEPGSWTYMLALWIIALVTLIASLIIRRKYKLKNDATKLEIETNDEYNLKAEKEGRPKRKPTSKLQMKIWGRKLLLGTIFFSIFALIAIPIYLWYTNSYEAPWEFISIAQNEMF